MFAYHDVSCRQCVYPIAVASFIVSLLFRPTDLPAQLVLSGGGLTLVQEGPAANMAGDPVPDLAQG